MLKNLLAAEPVVAAALALVVALTTILVAFGVHLTDVQVAAITGLAGAILGLAVVVRNAVTPVSR